MPVFYLPEFVPPGFRGLLLLNPFSYMVWCFPGCAVLRPLRAPWAWPVFAVAQLRPRCSSATTVFRRLRPIFGNVL